MVEIQQPQHLKTSAQPQRMAWSRLLTGKAIPDAHPPVRHLSEVSLPNLPQKPRQMKALHNEHDVNAEPQFENGVGLESVPDSIIDEIKIHAPLSEGKLKKAQQRQSLFLKKRRETKKHRILKNRFMVILRVVMFFVLTLAWVVMWRQDIWRYEAVHTHLHYSPTGESGFINHDRFEDLMSSYNGKTIFMIDPDDIAEKMMKRFPHIQDVVVRRRIFPAGLDVMVVEKPVWASYYRLALHDGSSLTDLKQRLYETTVQSTAIHSKTIKPFENVTLLHSGDSETVVPVSILSDTQKEKLQLQPTVFVQQQGLKADQRKSLEHVVYVLNQHKADFQKLGYELRLIDARDPEDTYLVFNRFKARLGRLDFTVAQRAERLVELLEPIQRYEKKLAWVELSWKGQVTFKLK